MLYCCQKGGEYAFMKPDFSEIVHYHCLRWQELPDLSLYMDQVLSILEKQLGVLACGPEDKQLTSTMINNYVKHKVIPAPVKKRYEKQHLASLMMVCIAKQVLSLTEIVQMMRFLTQTAEMEQVYDSFCEILERALQKVFAAQQTKEEPEQEIAAEMMKTLAGAFANKLYLQRMLLQQQTEKAE